MRGWDCVSRWVHVGVLLGWMACANVALSQSPNASEVQRILSSHTFGSSTASSFCRQFIDRFSRGEVEYLKPSASASEYDDGVFKSYRARCPLLKLNRVVQCSVGDYESIKSVSPQAREAEEDAVCNVYYGSRNFAVYDLTPNNLNSGPDLLFYFEAKLGPQDGRRRGGASYSDGGYAVVNTRQCKVLGVTPTHDATNYLSGATRQNYNGVIRYEGKAYAFDIYQLTDASTSDFRLRLEGLRKDGRWGGLCAFSVTNRGDTK